MPGWTLGGEVGGAARAKDELGREAGRWLFCLSVDCPPVSLTGMDDIQGCSRRCPRLQGDTGLGVVLRCSQRTGCWARAAAWQGSGWVSSYEQWAWGILPHHLYLLGRSRGMLQIARAERRSQRRTRVGIHSLQV